ncbi:helix-turn-helix transcriptional regulator [Streptomyces beihaiensis]|uniref:Helix-turn-helix transcriptional regulator n=1 Tax=Streptomyces beihaiensis TaxID=2984495 RepID=A0ABT3TT15_9ACTN|nr:helix-turn-helix transcriptional regulator [Streptomyces beihaiensis]MCX3060169.1 helix-turn-helix transcriptional regulator [Streptomyces beihaiensis]
MPPVFAHGRLRLYLLKLLDEAPRHGYEVIRLLEERFQGLYAPSAGTVYPRLAKLESEGLVTHTTEGGRKVYAITDAGRAELADRSGELADLELEIRESVAELAAEIRDDVRGAAGDLRREVRAAASQSRGARQPKSTPDVTVLTGAGDITDKDSWRAAKEELRRAKQEWKEQARRAKDESRRAREEAQRARRQAKETQDHVRAQAQQELQRMAKRVQDEVQVHFARGDWPTGVREGLSELAKEFGEFGRTFGKEFGTPSEESPGAAPDTDRAAGTGGKPEPRPDSAASGPRLDKDTGRGPEPEATATAAAPQYRPASEELPAEYVPSWAAEHSTGDPARDLDRLLDRFRDDIRDAARDHGVSEEQLRTARRHLSQAAAHIGASLRTPAT